MVHEQCFYWVITWKLLFRRRGWENYWGNFSSGGVDEQIFGWWGGDSPHSFSRENLAKKYNSTFNCWWKSLLVATSRLHLLTISHWYQALQPGNTYSCILKVTGQVWKNKKRTKVSTLITTTISFFFPKPRFIFLILISLAGKMPPPWYISLYNFLVAHPNFYEIWWLFL